MQNTDKQREENFEPQAKYGTREPAYEQADVHIKPLFFFGLVWFLTAGLIALLLILMYAFYQKRAETQEEVISRIAAPTAFELPPAPRLQTSPQMDLQELLNAEDKILTTYSVDPNTSMIRVPIDHAIELMMTKYQLPAVADAGTALDAGTTQPQDSSSGRAAEAVR